MSKSQFRHHAVTKASSGNSDTKAQVQLTGGLESMHENSILKKEKRKALFLNKPKKRIPGRHICTADSAASIALCISDAVSPRLRLLPEVPAKATNEIDYPSHYESKKLKLTRHLLLRDASRLLSLGTPIMRISSWLSQIRNSEI